MKGKTYMNTMITKLRETHDLTDDELRTLLTTDAFDADLQEAANAVRIASYGRDVYLRGLIEFTNYCKNNCLYCGIRRDNREASRYRLTPEDIMECCAEGYALGYRTFVLQGGEDPYYTDDRICALVSAIAAQHPDCRITLSIGEKSRESYQRYYDAGARRYLLRHETADKAHYEMLHPANMSFEHRMQCLRDLHEIGYQVGCGMMVGSPGQKIEHLVKDLRFLQEFKPEMVGIGPFIPHRDTQYADEQPGTVGMTLRLLSVIRLLLPEVLLPATTALGTIDVLGREKGITAGANVVMPNLSPVGVRGKYLLYDNKICTGDEAAECIRCMTLRVAKTGYKVVESRGDHIGYRK